MKNKSKQKTNPIDAATLCLVVFTIGLLLAFSGCSSTFRLETTKSIHPNWEIISHDNYIGSSN